ncbi:MAG TPA: TorF family putative porin [Halothiobacillus sp.]|nr:TorF family putative porin [Halothiobacillus sp.]
MNKFKMTLIASSVVASLSTFAVPAVYAADAPAVSLSGSAAVVSDYRWRGLSQSYKKPAVQVGINLGLPAGFYAGFWGSSISNAALYGPTLAGVETDWFAGYNYKLNDDVSFDVGGIYVYYPTNAGSSGINTGEVHVAATYKWLTAQYNVDTTKYYGLYDSKGTSYIQLDGHYPLTADLTLDAHIGHQMFKGSRMDGTSNSNLNYSDWLLGATYTMPAGTFAPGWAVSLAYISTNASKSVYGNTPSDPTSATSSSKWLNGPTAVLSLSKSF